MGDSYSLSSLSSQSSQVKSSQDQSVDSLSYFGGVVTLLHQEYCSYHQYQCAAVVAVVAVVLAVSVVCKRTWIRSLCRLSTANCTKLYCIIICDT